LLCCWADGGCWFSRWPSCAVVVRRDDVAMTTAAMAWNEIVMLEFYRMGNLASLSPDEQSIIESYFRIKFRRGSIVDVLGTAGD